MMYERIYKIEILTELCRVKGTMSNTQTETGVNVNEKLYNLYTSTCLYTFLSYEEVFEELNDLELAGDTTYTDGKQHYNVDDWDCLDNERSLEIASRIAMLLRNELTKKEFMQFLEDIGDFGLFSKNVAKKERISKMIDECLSEV